VDALDEIDIGEWTGLSFAELDGDPRWQQWNTCRSVARCPGGETMGEVQARVLGHLAAASAAHPEGRLVLVSHADVIKAGLLHFLGRTLDGYAAIEIAPAGVSTVVVADGGARVLRMNERVAA
jgi:broad specificity phosphatase PhoE